MDDKTTTLVLSSRVYDSLRLATTILLPGLATLYFTIAQILVLPGGNEVTAITTAVCTFLGLILGASRRNYNRSDARFDGAITVSPGEDEDSSELRVQLNPEAVLDKDELTVRVERRDIY